VAAVDKELVWLNELAPLVGGKAFVGRLEIVRADLSNPGPFEEGLSSQMSQPKDQ